MLRIDRLIILAICGLGLMPATAGAQVSEACRSSLNGQRLTVIVPNAAGGGYDTYARALAPVIDDLTGMHSTVVNMPAAGGLVAMTTLADTGVDQLSVMVENATDVLRSRVQPGSAPWLERLQAVSVFHTEPSSWIGKPELLFASAKDLVAASSSADGAIEFNLVGRSLGIDVKLISGFDGSKETEAAVLRGDADLFSGSLSTSLKAAKSGDLELKLLLSDKPNDRAPGVPHLAGEDGLVATLTKDLSPEERTRRLDMASLAVRLSYDVRTVFTHRNLRADLRDCLADALQSAVRDPDFAKAAEAQGRPVTPVDRAEAEALIASAVAAMAKLTSLNLTP